MPWKSPPFVVLAVAWFTLPLTAGAALTRMLDHWDAATPVRVAVWILAAGTYGAGVLSLFRPGSPGLVTLRHGSALLVWPAIAGLFGLERVAGMGLVALLVIVVGLAFSPAVAQVSADAGAFRGERRFALAAHPGVQWALAPVAAAFMVIPMQWRLARRWLVLVPSGVVLHDPMLLDDTFRLSPADVGAVALTAEGWRERLSADDVLDVTGGVPRALWIGLTAPVVPPGARPGVRRPAANTVRHVFCAPYERGEAAAALAAKGYPLDDPVGPP